MHIQISSALHANAYLRVYQYSDILRLQRWLDRLAGLPITDAHKHSCLEDRFPKCSPWVSHRTSHELDARNPSWLLEGSRNLEHWTVATQEPASRYIGEHIDSSWRLTYTSQQTLLRADGVYGS
jgi:hypothetical protein